MPNYRRHILSVERFGEATGKVSAKPRANLLGIPRASAVSMRNHLSCGNFEINTEIVCKTIEDKQPGLLRTLRAENP